jgi:hypothetical protein
VRADPYHVKHKAIHGILLRNSFLRSRFDLFDKYDIGHVALT